MTTSPWIEGSEEQPPLMPVRRLHNFVYCPRLFYLQWVEGVFVPNEDTVMGSAIHGRVDEPSRLRDELLADSGGTLRSVALSSERLGLTGIADLVEQDADAKRLRHTAKICESYGNRIQFSVFEASLDNMAFASLRVELDAVINHADDQVLFVNLGLDDASTPFSMESIGLPYVKKTRLTII